jgi:DNA-binding MarR family transcriptional regulator
MAPETKAAPVEAKILQQMSPWILVTELYWMSYKLLERRFYHLGISASQARVLGLLHFAQKPMRPSLLATLLFQETQSITGILNRIEAHGWVRRAPDPDDRRAVSIELTPKGKEVAAEIVQISQELYEDLFAKAITAAERKQVEAILKKIRVHGFQLSDTDFKLRRAQRYALWSD